MFNQSISVFSLFSYIDMDFLEWWCV